MDHHPLLVAVDPLLRAIGADLVPLQDAGDGDVTLHWDGAPVAAVRLPDLNGALDRLVGDVERELACPLAELPREARREAIHLLDARGAFTLRRAVEQIAELMGVSRFTVYNHLNADRSGSES